MSLWWAEHAVELPAWAQLAARVFLVSPTSAAVERVFSILRDSFHHGQNGALTGRLRGVFAHAPVQQPAWLWPSEALVRRSSSSTAVPPHGGEKTGRKRRNLTCMHC